MPKPRKTPAPAELHYQILLYHDGDQYAAIVPELEGCRSTGASYAEALASAETAIRRFAAAAADAGQVLPAPSPDFVLRPVATRPGIAAPIMRRLHHKFGILSNRELAERMGLQDASIQSFAGAAAGQGSRLIRCTIAQELGEKPSKLWPDRPFKARKRDDEQHAKMFDTIEQ